MKSNLRFLLIAAAVGLIISLGWVVRAQQEKPAPKVAWEHSVVAAFPGDDTTRLDRLGAEGWELVAVRSEERFTGNFRQTEVIYYLKRAKPAAR